MQKGRSVYTEIYEIPESREIWMLLGHPYEFYMEKRQKDGSLVLTIGFRSLKRTRVKRN